jgi:hypothetical protein
MAGEIYSNSDGEIITEADGSFRDCCCDNVYPPPPGYYRRYQLNSPRCGCLAGSGGSYDDCPCNIVILKIAASPPEYINVNGYIYKYLDSENLDEEGIAAYLASGCYSPMTDPEPYTPVTYGYTAGFSHLLTDGKRYDSCNNCNVWICDVVNGNLNYILCDPDGLYPDGATFSPSSWGTYSDSETGGSCQGCSGCGDPACQTGAQTEVFDIECEFSGDGQFHRYKITGTRVGGFDCAGSPPKTDLHYISQWVSNCRVYQPGPVVYIDTGEGNTTDHFSWSPGVIVMRYQ